MAYNIYHIYITNIKDNGVIEPVQIRLTNQYLRQIGATLFQSNKHYHIKCHVLQYIKYLSS
jgi:hypothetical protein